MILRSGDPENPTGPVAATTGFSNEMTLPYNVIWLEMVKGFLLNDLTFGWSRIAGLLSPENYIPNFGGEYSQCKTDILHYGDPGLQYWKGVPRIVEANFPETICPTDRMIEIRVGDPEEEEWVSGAQVSLYAPGEMPEFDQAEYADYDEMFMMTKISDADGWARFVIPWDVEFQEGIMNITVTGRDILPLLEEIVIEAPDTGVEMTAWFFEEIEGNGDEDINPGESILLNIAVHNISGDEALENLTATITSTSPYLEIAEDNVIQFEEIEPDGDVEGGEGVVITILPDCPDGVSRPVTRPTLCVTLNNQRQTWETAIQINPASANLVVDNVVGGGIIGTADENINLDIRNIGLLRSPRLNVRLALLEGGIRIVDGNAVLPSIDPGDQGNLIGQGFTVSGMDIAVPGLKVEMALVFESEAGFSDSAFFELQVMEPRENDPQGRDDYGYICFDDTDENWEMSPVYDWVEIDPRDEDAIFEGEEMEFRGESPQNIGEALVLDLPFETQFYGHIYDQITVATNGFISMGDQEDITNFQNWPMDRCIGGGVGMLAPFWDDLMMGDNGEVFFHYDEDEERFIVEWSRFRHRWEGERDLIFQVILYDRDVWVTETGDQDILFQYRMVAEENVRGNWEDGRVPFASVGISSPDGTTGINYSFNNQRPITSAPLEDERVLLFTTGQRIRIGTLFGRVTDFETGEPIEGARVGDAVADENGDWIIPEFQADLQFTLYCSAEGYNDSLLIGLFLDEGEELELNIALTHPEFESSEDELDVIMESDEVLEVEFEIVNFGNGPLEWSAEKIWRDGNNFENWELRRQIPVGQIVEDSRVQGAVFVNDRFYVAGSNNREPQIYVLNREGDLIEQFDQFGPDGGYGYRDLAFDGEWIWGSFSTDIYAFTPEGELMREFEGPFNPNSNFAWDSDRELLWVSGTTSNIIALDREGNQVEELDRFGLRTYGLSYYPEDPDGFPLYIFHKDRDLGDQLVTKMNPENNDTMFVRILEPEGEGTSWASFCTDQYDPLSWVFIGVINQGENDRLDIWQIDRNFDWFELDSREGEIGAGGSREFILTFDAAGFTGDIILEAAFRFYHNAAGGVFDLPVTMEVFRENRRMIEIVPGWNIISVNVVPQDPDIRELMRPLVDAEILRIVKDGFGRFYNPEWDFCNIPEWDESSGYMMNLAEASQWQVLGESIPENQPIELREGWNMSAYFPRRSVDAEVALAGIVDNLIIAKDGLGRFYLTEHRFCNMGNLEEGKGYQYNMREATELVYQIGEEIALAGSGVGHPRHFLPLSSTGANMSVLLVADEQFVGSEAGCFNAHGLLIGSGCFDSEGRCGIAVWGDDFTTEVVDGAIEGEVLTFILWDGVEEIEVSPVPTEGKPVWENGGLLLSEISIDTAAPVTFGIHETYPNPTNGPVRLSFGLENDAVVSLMVYDLSGRLVSTLAQGEFRAGNHQLVWDTDGVSSGLYLVKLIVPGRSHIQKIAVLK